jgi:hypothetical protein
MDVLVLRNYACSASWSVALKLAETLYSSRYGMLAIDPNVPDSWPDGEDGDGIRRWYTAVRKRIEHVDAVVVLLSSALNEITPQNLRGVGLLSEVLAFWSAPESADPSKLIFVCIDCELCDIRSPPGLFEHLQDIIVPMARASEPICVSSELVTTAREEQLRLADFVVSRLGVGDGRCVYKDEAHVQFFLLEDDGPVGLLEMAGSLISEGEYAYTPMRSVAHYRLGESVRAGLSVPCYCETARGRATFEVVAIPAYGRIAVGDVRNAG